VPPHTPERFGSYLLVKRLGQGGMGDVSLARPLSDRQGVPDLVVVKRMREELVEREDFMRRFRHEAAIATKLEHEHVARVYDVGAVGQVLYITFEYIDGWSLLDLMERLHTQRRPASLSSVADVLDGALRGLEALHNVSDPATGEHLEFVHRDLAPKNIMVGRDGVTRLIDLGLGKSTIQDWKTNTGVLMGSLGYMAPEQVRTDKIDQRTDLYAMGIVLWEFLTLARYIKKGSTPLTLQASLAPEFRPPSSLRSDVNKTLDGVLRRALSHDPANRFQSAYEFRSSLRAAVPGWEPGQDVATLVADFIETDDSKAMRTEIAQLMTLAVPPSRESMPDEKTVVFAQAEGVKPFNKGDVHAQTAAARPSAKLNAEINSGETTAAADDSPVEQAISAPPQRPSRPAPGHPTGTPPAAGHPTGTPPVMMQVGPGGQPVHVVYVQQEPVPFSRKVLVAVSLLAVVITAVVAGLTVGKNLLAPQPTPSPSAAAPIPPSTEPGALVGRANDAVPDPGSAAPAEPAIEPAASPEVASPQPKPKPKKRSKRRRAKKPAPKKKRAAKQAKVTSREALVKAVDQLSKRADDAARSLPASSPKAKRLNNIRTELLLVLSTNDLERASKKVRRIRSELDALTR